MLPGQRYTQNIITVPAGERVSFDVGFTPSNWIIFPKNPIAIGSYIYVAVDARFAETGLPLSGTGQLTLPGLGGDKVYMRNTGGADVDMYIIASKGIEPTSVTLPVTTEQYGGMQSDIIESMATLGAGRVWRRTGRVIYATGWEMADVDWFVGGGEAVRTEEFAHRGGACLEMTPPASVAASDCSRRAPFIPSTRPAIEMSVWMAPGSTLFRAAMIFHNGLLRHAAAVEIDPVNLDIYIFTTVGGIFDRTKIGDMRSDWRDANMQFHNIKLVANFDTLRYEGLHIDDQQWDLSDHLMWESAVGLTYYIELKLEAFDDTSAQNKTYVDDFIQTIDEPEGLFK